MSAALYLIPIAIANPEEKPFHTPEIETAIKQCEGFIVENARTARRALKKVMPNMEIDDFQWIVYDKHKGWPSEEIKQAFSKNKNWGLLSEAGCPAVADPGELVVKWAHESQYQVKPLVGPNSILLALMSSGLNGQHFKFSSYLPIDKKKCIFQIKKLEQESKQEKLTQIFIETPYRGQELFKLFLQHLHPKTLLCVAAGIQTENEFIETHKVEDWKINKVNIHKIPTVFLFLSQY